MHIIRDIQKELRLVSIRLRQPCALTPQELAELNLRDRLFRPFQQFLDLFDIDFRRRIVLMPHHFLHPCGIRVIPQGEGRGRSIVLAVASVFSHWQTTSALTILPSLPLDPRSPSSSLQIANKVHRQLSVLTSLRSCECLHDLLVVMYHLLVLPWSVRFSFLAIQHLGLCEAITEMLYPPPSWVVR